MSSQPGIIADGRVHYVHYNASHDFELESTDLA